MSISQISYGHEYTTCRPRGWTFWAIAAAIMGMRSDLNTTAIVYGDVKDAMHDSRRVSLDLLNMHTL